MNQDDILNIFEEYFIKNKKNYRVLVNGEWGVGKRESRIKYFKRLIHIRYLPYNVRST